MPEINLLPEEERKEVAEAKSRRRIFFYSIFVLSVTVAVAVVIFGYWLVLIRDEKQLETRISTLSSQIQSLSRVETQARTLKSKVAAISAISKKTQNFESLLSDIAQMTPAGVILSGLQVSDQNLITITGEANSQGEFSGFVTTLLRAGVTKTNLSALTVESITRDDKGIYKFSISAKTKN